MMLEDIHKSGAGQEAGGGGHFIFSSQTFIIFRIKTKNSLTKRKVDSTA